MNKTIEDVMICPHCGSDDCREYDFDEIDFSCGNEHCIVYCACNTCHKNFELSFAFEYNITKSWVR